MKYQLFLIILLIIPIAIAEENTFSDGTLTTTYPESAIPGEEITINFNAELTSNSIREMKLPINNKEFECEETICQGTHNLVMPNYPITIFLSLELNDARGNIESTMDNEADFSWTEIGSEDTLIYFKRFTILPTIPQIKIINSTPYLDEEIIDKTNELTDKTITKEQFKIEKEIGKNIRITKEVEFKKIETENGEKIRSVWTIKLEPKKNIKKATGIYIYEDIPKEGAATSDDIISASKRFTVLRHDPLVMWHFEEINEPIEITYETNKADITGAATVITVEEIEKGNIYQKIISS